MKKFLFSLTMLAAVALAGFTTSCADGGNDDNNDNVFLVTSNRFCPVEEDEVPIHHLVNEY